MSRGGAREGAGRPKSPASKDKRIMVRVDGALYRRITEAAELAQTKPATLCYKILADFLEAERKIK